MDTHTEQRVLADLRQLDPFSQRELLDFLAFLRHRRTQQQPASKPETDVFERYAPDLLEEKQAELSSRPNNTPEEIRQLLAATRGSLPGKKSKDQIDQELRRMRDEWVREWEFTSLPSSAW